jgi:uncharacterized protein (DUF885 family)
MTASTIAQLSQEFLEVTSAANPFVASVFGVPGYDHAVPDLSEAAELATAKRLLELADRAEQVPVESLEAQDRVTRAVLIHTARADAVPLQDRHTEFALSGHASATSVLLAVVAYTRLTSPESVRNYLSRVEGLPRFISDARDRALAGAGSGLVSTRRGVQQTVDRLRDYLSASIDDDLIVRPALGTPIEDQVRTVVADRVRPAMVDLVEALAGAVLDAARPDEQCGILHLPDGPARYARAVEAHTTTTRTPEEIHQLGLDLCASLREELSELGQRVFGLNDYDAVVDRLRHDPELRYHSAQEILDDARAAVARADGALDEWFGRTYRVPCVVEPMNALVAPTAVVGEYMPPAAVDNRPGQYNVNTYQPHTRTRYEYEALSFHEGVPGHHLQFALAQELDHLPAFRRYLYVTAFGEGWGLYSERLADEMGLYSGDLHRFGMVSFDSWRACRLVVDTGMHHYGWPRQRAIDFMLANSAATLENITNEVDRYIAWPGQALAYMCGRMEIDDLRRRAKERLGAQFDIRGFHDAVLSNGSVPLAVLASEVDRWVNEQIDRTAQ